MNTLTLKGTTLQPGDKVVPQKSDATDYTYGGGEHIAQFVGEELEVLKFRREKGYVGIVTPDPEFGGEIIWRRDDLAPVRVKATCTVTTKPLSM